MEICPLQNPLFVPQGHEHQHDRIVRHGIRVITGIADGDAQRFCGGDFDMVIADGAGAEEPNPSLVHSLQHLPVDGRCHHGDRLMAPEHGNVILQVVHGQLFRCATDFPVVFLRQPTKNFILIIGAAAEDK